MRSHIDFAHKVELVIKTTNVIPRELWKVGSDHDTIFLTTSIVRLKRKPVGVADVPVGPKTSNPDEFTARTLPPGCPDSRCID